MIGSLLAECSILTHSLRGLSLTFNSGDDSGPILLGIKSMQSS